MASMPIHNETDYPLTDNMRQHIISDVHEHFGGQVRSIRVQYGIARHTFHARTREVRYAFSSTDFGLFDTVLLPETSASPIALPALYECDQRELVEKQMRDHGKTPSYTCCNESILPGLSGCGISRRLRVHDLACEWEGDRYGNTHKAAQKRVYHLVME